MDNPVKHLCKKIHKITMTGFWFTSFQSYDFKRHDQTAIIWKFLSKIKFSTIFFTHSMTSEVKDHSIKLLIILQNTCVKNFIRILRLVYVLQASEVINSNGITKHKKISIQNKIFINFSDLWWPLMRSKAMK